MLTDELLNRLYRYGFSLTNNESNAYDLLQDALERYLKHQHTNRPAEAPEFFIRRIMRNRFIDQLRHERRFPLHSLNDVDDRTADMDLQNLDDMAVTQQTLERIWNVLDPFDRELLHLWAVEEYTAREIAEQFEVARGTILSRIHRLRIRLRKLADDDTAGLSEGHKA